MPRQYIRKDHRKQDKRALRWANVDWSRSNREIADSMGAPLRTVQCARNVRNIQLPPTENQEHEKWMRDNAAILSGMTASEIKKFSGRDISIDFIFQARKRIGIPSRAVSTVDELLATCVVVPGSGCWYRRKSVLRLYPHFNGEPGHHAAYKLVHGNIPVGMVIRHTCDNTRCVNPNHLIPGTQAENMRDREDRGRGGAWKFSPEDWEAAMSRVSRWSDCVAVASEFGMHPMSLFNRLCRRRKLQQISNG